MLDLCSPLFNMWLLYNHTTPMLCCFFCNFCSHFCGWILHERHPRFYVHSILTICQKCDRYQFTHKCGIYCAFDHTGGVLKSSDHLVAFLNSMQKIHSRKSSHKTVMLKREQFTKPEIQRENMWVSSLLEERKSQCGGEFKFVTLNENPEQSGASKY